MLGRSRFHRATKMHQRSEEEILPRFESNDTDLAEVEDLSETPFLDQLGGNETFAPGKLLGQGAYGQVQRYDGSLGGSLVSKTAKPGGEDELEREKQALKQLGPHENVVGTSDVDLGDGGLVMENLSGGNVDQAFEDLQKGYEDGSISHSEYWGAVQYLMRGTLQGLQHVNEGGLTHGDVKPGNIGLDEEMTPKLIDFGSSVKIGEEFGPTTPMINAPSEAIGGDHKTTETSDVFAVGNMTHFMGEGSWAHDDGNQNQYSIGIKRMEALRNGTDAIGRDEAKGSAYGEFVNALTSPNPQNRPTSGQSLDAPFLQDSLLDDDQARELLKRRRDKRDGKAPPPPPPPPELARVTATKEDRSNKKAMLKELLKVTKGRRKEYDGEAKDRAKSVKTETKARRKRR